MFHNEVVVVEGDDSITTRLLNLDGTVYFSNNHVMTEHDSDSMSMVEFGRENNGLIDDDNGMTFLDAMDQNPSFDRNGYVCCPRIL